MSFGASHGQVTLHTGVFFITETLRVFVQFLTRRHDVIAIWQYIQPVIEFIKDNFTEVHTLHFWIDGPTTQYRNKINFYLCSTLLGV